MKTLLVILFLWLSPFATAGRYTLAEYAADCEKHLGTIPDIRCSEGEEIPVFNSDLGTPITSTNHSGYHTQCDNPSLLRSPFETWISGINPCVPHARIGRLKPQAGFPTEWVFFCRRYFNRSRYSNMYDDINLIGHNPATGATCFFVDHPNRTAPNGDSDSGRHGERIPAIRSAKGMEYWKGPRQIETQPVVTGGTPLCTDCHDADPWVHSPHVDQVLVNGEPVVPSNPHGKYWLVGVGSGMSPNWKTKHLVSPQANACTACHRIGNKRGCDTMTNLAAGLDSIPHMTKAFALSPFMPAESGRAEVRVGHKLGKEDLAAVNFINACCQRPGAAECRWEELPR